MHFWWGLCTMYGYIHGFWWAVLLSSVPYCIQRTNNKVLQQRHINQPTNKQDMQRLQYQWYAGGKRHGGKNGGALLLLINLIAETFIVFWCFIKFSIPPGKWQWQVVCSDTIWIIVFWALWVEFQLNLTALLGIRSKWNTYEQRAGADFVWFQVGEWPWQE